MKRKKKVKVEVVKVIGNVVTYSISSNDGKKPILIQHNIKNFDNKIKELVKIREEIFKKQLEKNTY